MNEVRDAEDREHAEQAFDSFVKEYQAKWPKATDKLAEDREELLAFYDVPGRALGPPEDDQPHRVHLRHRAVEHQGDQGTGLKVSRTGHGLQAHRAGPDPVAQVNAPHLVALVRAGVTFEKGVMIERTDEQDGEVAA